MIAEYVQPVLIALAVLLIPACARLAATSVSNKLDEGRKIAEEVGAEVKTELEAKHKANTVILNEIETQVTITNGVVKEHTIQLARIEGAVFGASAMRHEEK